MPEASIREGPEELTLRAEEVGSQKSCINVDHTAEDRWGPPLVDADWHAFCQAIYKGFEGSEWEELIVRAPQRNEKGRRSKEAKCKSKGKGPLEGEGGKRQ